MPTYEYECLECKKRFEVFQSIKAEPIQACTSCKGKVRKLFGTTGIIFKGSGFYVNDYKKNGGTKRNAAPGGAGDAPASASESSTASGSGGGSSD